QMFREEEAMKLFRRLLELPPDTEDLYEIIDKVGDFLMDEEDVDGAIEFYSDAMRVFPEAPIFKAGLGYCYAKKGMHSEACQWHKEACEQEPDNAKLLSDYGWTLFEAGKMKKAIKVLKRAVRFSPDDYEMARNNLAYVRTQVGNLNG
ncbi:MAG: tetratricopeptide repeat protein, partial [Spartobacteria bacterium]|nr:tetratricopeptide repeat protein [Spartobacteria bacterium]